MQAKENLSKERKEGKREMSVKAKKVSANKGIHCQCKQSVSSKTATAGITLVALVVTIVVLLILAGITIAYVFGDNSVFKQASEAKLKTEIANWQERLETAKNSIIIDGLGIFDPDAYFKYIQDQDIADNVIDNGDGTYDVTTKPGYVFLITLVPKKEKPTDIEIEYLGQTGNLQPKIKGINIVEATKTSFKIKVSARLEGGTIDCYYKDKASVASNEAENDISGYEAITLDSNLEGSVTSGLTAGTTYKVKAVLKKDGSDVGWVSKEVTTSIIVTSITLNKTTTKIDMGKSETLIATVEPANAENKEIEWTAEPSTIATVDQNGKVTGVSVGTATITATAKDGSGVVASCTVTVEKAESDWEKIAKIAQAIAEGKGKTSSGGAVNNRSNEAIVTLEGESEPITITVGQEFYAKHNGIIRTVRVMGFNHDTLTTPTATATKAGISFEFTEFMIDETKQMNATNDNTQGWKETAMRTYLEGAEGIGKLSETLQSKIKQVKKDYLLGKGSTTVQKSDDKLWLLSCSEIWNKGRSDNSGAAYGLAKAKEGEQYQWYKSHEQGIDPKDANSSFVKKTTSGSALEWWLRSPNYSNATGFCYVTNNGNSYGSKVSISSYVAPGFSI